MTEIERIIRQYQCNQIEFDGLDEWLTAYSEAIGQYIIKARIEELRNFCNCTRHESLVRNNRILELKKALRNDG